MPTSTNSLTAEENLFRDTLDFSGKPVAISGVALKIRPLGSARGMSPELI
jgi:hypothetical protein